MTNHSWATWADFIGANFDEFHNFARGGGCNTFAANRLIEIDKLANLNPNTDYVIVGITGFNRFSWLDSQSRWVSGGDIKTLNQQLFNEPTPPWADANNPFKDGVWNFTFGLYQSYVAINTIKSFLTLKKIPHKLIMSLNNIFYKTHADLLGIEAFNSRMVDDIYNMTDIKYSLEEFKKDDPDIYFPEDKMRDGHPSQLLGYQYIKKFFPEFDTIKTKEFFEESEKVWIGSSLAKQVEAWSTFRRKTSPCIIKYADRLIGG
jgi:hypothetical protein